MVLVTLASSRFNKMLCQTCVMLLYVPRDTVIRCFYGCVRACTDNRTTADRE